MNQTLAEWNQADQAYAIQSLISCCASIRWAQGTTAKRPFEQEDDLFEAADEVWSVMREPDWLEAFAAHPRIGERKIESATAQSKAWSEQEQSAAASAQNEIITRLAELNKLYEVRFGFTYIVCATSKSADEMLQILEARLANDRQAELLEAAEQQRQITQLRLRKWLAI